MKIENVCMLVLGWLLPSPLLLHPVPAESLGYWGGTGYIQPPASPSLETPSQAQTVGCLLIPEAAHPSELDKQESPCLIPQTPHLAGFRSLPSNKPSFLKLRLVLCMCVILCVCTYVHASICMLQ